MFQRWRNFGFGNRLVEFWNVVVDECDGFVAAAVVVVGEEMEETGDAAEGSGTATVAAATKEEVIGRNFNL